MEGAIVRATPGSGYGGRDAAGKAAVSGPRPAGRHRPRVAVARVAGRLELQVDGVAYSVFDSDGPWSGYVWDALAASVLLHPEPAPRVLMLGCAGGTVLALVRRLRPRARLTAVELEPGMIAVARERFGLDDHGAEVIEADGVAWVDRTRRRFDVIVDDMYAAGRRGLQRPVGDEEDWLARVASRLAPGGIAVTNATTDDDPPGLAVAVRDAHRAVFADVVSLEPRLGMNVVFAGRGEPFDLPAFDEAAAPLPDVDVAAVRDLLVRREPR